MTTPVNPIVDNTGAAAGTSGSGSSGAGSSGTGSIGGLTMNDFLTLMTAQLQNQDPLNPTDANQFLSQLSELSTVEGISQLNTNLSSLSSSMLSSQAVSSAGLVGQTVLAQESAAAYTGGSLSGAVQVPTGATAVTLTISDANGTPLGNIALPATAGLQSFSWNGTTASGATVPNGVYGITATAKVGGVSQAATTYLNGTVSSITLDSSSNSVLLNTPQLGSVALGSVLQID
jgi:flagellar basal-body rod modification protein FlgD